MNLGGVNKLKEENMKKLIIGIVGWVLGRLFDNDPLYDDAMGYVPFAKDGLDDEEQD